MKTLALVAWIPVVVGAILATYGNAAWNKAGVTAWMVGLAIQFGSFVLWLRRLGRGGVWGGAAA